MVARDWYGFSNAVADALGMQGSRFTDDDRAVIAEAVSPAVTYRALDAAYLTFFPVTVNMSRGLRAVDPDALALMRALAASSRQILFKLRFPASLPYLFTALRISATARAGATLMLQ